MSIRNINYLSIHLTKPAVLTRFLNKIKQDLISLRATKINKTFQFIFKLLIKISFDNKYKCNYNLGSGTSVG